MRIIKPCNSLYQNPWDLVKKTTLGKYHLIHIAMKLNRVTVWDANFSLSADRFSENFASYAISSAIDFFLDYNQVKLDKNFQDLIAFKTPLSFMWMTTLPQDVTNSINQFVWIVFKIPSLELQDRAKHFLDNVE